MEIDSHAIPKELDPLLTPSFWNIPQADKIATPYGGPPPTHKQKELVDFRNKSIEAMLQLVTGGKTPSPYKNLHHKIDHAVNSNQFKRIMRPSPAPRKVQGTDTNVAAVT